MFDNLTIVQRMALKDALEDKYFKSKSDLRLLQKDESRTNMTREQIQMGYDYTTEEINSIVDMLKYFDVNFSKVDRVISTK